MNALVLSAGIGERMKPLTDTVPKPLLPVIHEPMIRVIIERLFAHGIERIGVNCYHRAGQVAEYLSRLDDRILVKIEHRLRGTGGALKNFGSFSPDDLIIHSGDVLSDVDLAGLAAFHRERRARATLVLVKQSGTNVVMTDDGVHIREVSDRDEPDGLTYAGIAVLSGSVFSLLPPEETFSIVDVLRAILKDRGAVLGYRHASVWYNINSPRAYWRLHRDILTGQTVIDGIPAPGAFAIHPSSTVRSNALRGFVVVGARARVEKDVALENTIVFTDTVVSGGTYRDALLSNNFCVHMN